jgi:hypothetical protein
MHPSSKSSIELGMNHASLGTGLDHEANPYCQRPEVRFGLCDLIEHSQEWDACREAINSGAPIESARELRLDVLMLELFTAVYVLYRAPAEAVSARRADSLEVNGEVTYVIFPLQPA